jgi:G3E family GTPase
LKELFDIRAFSASKSAAAALADASSHDHPDEASHGHVHPHLTTTVIPLPILTANQYVKFEEFIQSLLWESKLIGKSEGPEVLRSKGVAVLDDGRAFVLQGVRDLYELKELPGQDVQAGKVVFIGRGIGNGDAVKSALLRHLGIE